MRVYVYVCTYVCMYAYGCSKFPNKIFLFFLHILHTFDNLYVCMNIRVHVCMHVAVSLCMYEYMRACMYASMYLAVVKIDVSNCTSVYPLLRSESGVAACSHSFHSPRLFFLLLGPIWSNSGLFFSESGQMDSERRRGVYVPDMNIRTRKTWNALSQLHTHMYMCMCMLVYMCLNIMYVCMHVCVHRHSHS